MYFKVQILLGNDIIFLILISDWCWYIFYKNIFLKISAFSVARLSNP